MQRNIESTPGELCCHLQAQGVSQCVSIAIRLFNFDTPHPACTVFVDSAALPSFQGISTSTVQVAWVLPISLRLHESPASQSSRLLAQSEWRNSIILRRSIMTWSKPEFIDWRFGFEITLYIANR